MATEIIARLKKKNNILIMVIVILSVLLIAETITLTNFSFVEGNYYEQLESIQPEPYR